MTLTVNDPRGQLVLSEAITFAIEGMSRLPEEHRPKIFSSKTPQSVPTFLVGGRIAGTWRYEKGKVKAEPFVRLDSAARRELREETDRLADLHA